MYVSSLQEAEKGEGDVRSHIEPAMRGIMNTGSRHTVGVGLERQVVIAIAIARLAAELCCLLELLDDLVQR